ncbi:nuclear envelope phosphatase-regulatory subunit 1 isoform X2 [Apodemus sylvaticus]|uniref:nuclear envelope phosphatase-regulatory subunit 1 isoform X2 n=1 Tax=Apodemus sylvaticus TaxID=10129 RepID=UPI002243E6FC|nr:nuclear envelope phosphatase-regulatory subunit 1 isoform X2 [Apodemus sylvaticus]
MNSLEQAEDLKAFERRLTEYIHCLQPATGRWRMLLIVVSVCTATGAWNWLIDPETQKDSDLKVVLGAHLEDSDLKAVLGAHLEDSDLKVVLGAHLEDSDLKAVLGAHLEDSDLKVSFFTSLWNHPFFTISCITLIGLFFAGIHKRVVAPSIIAARCRTVLAEYNMSCDDTGKLILKPRPHVQ